ncbi:hypothetical protein BIW11_14159 [Tropilaelaps mercedesae]|uniref:Uncharacterized protein n=1 Tax=Tropilaelaps mercedesae TaxID=418985 RepID=A0A1V9WZ41_9ACAR|nr:hypothetical protein BIW11_14159 [Tropilaelaps mercedesae]
MHDRIIRGGWKNARSSDVHQQEENQPARPPKYGRGRGLFASPAQADVHEDQQAQLPEYGCGRGLFAPPAQADVAGDQPVQPPEYGRRCGLLAPPAQNVEGDQPVRSPECGRNHGLSTPLAQANVKGDRSVRPPVHEHALFPPPAQTEPAAGSGKTHAQNRFGRGLLINRGQTTDFVGLPASRYRLQESDDFPAHSQLADTSATRRPNRTMGRGLKDCTLLAAQKEIPERAFASSRGQSPKRTRTLKRGATTDIPTSPPKQVSSGRGFSPENGLERKCSSRPHHIFDSVPVVTADAGSIPARFDPGDSLMDTEFREGRAGRCYGYKPYLEQRRANEPGLARLPGPAGQPGPSELQTPGSKIPIGRFREFLEELIEDIVLLLGPVYGFDMQVPQIREFCRAFGVPVLRLSELNSRGPQIFPSKLHDKRVFKDWVKLEMLLRQLIRLVVTKKLRVSENGYYDEADHDAYTLRFYLKYKRQGYVEVGYRRQIHEVKFEDGPPVKIMLCKRGIPICKMFVESRTPGRAGVMNFYYTVHFNDGKPDSRWTADMRFRIGFESDYYEPRSDMEGESYSQ